MEDALEGESLVLRGVDRLDLLVMHVGFLSSQDVLQEVDGHVVYDESNINDVCVEDVP